MRNMDEQSDTSSFEPTVRQVTNPLSKSRYLSGDQCHLRLWYDTHTPDLAPDVDDNLHARFDTGHEVGEMACRRYPGGHLVAQDHRHIEEALEETRKVMEANASQALFEAAFVHQGVLVRADVIEHLPDGGWGLIEVKSATGLKDVFVLDVAVQLWVLRGAGLDVREAGVLTLDRDYVYDGKRLDLNALFKLHPVLDQAEALLDSVGGGVREMQAMIETLSPPAIEPGKHCSTPYSCPYFAHCRRDLAKPKHGLNELPRLSTKSADGLKAAGIEEIRDIPPDTELTPLQRIVWQAVREERAVVHGNLREELARTTPPVRFLDFETFSPAIPRFAGTRPYDAIPFLFSVHTQRDGPPPSHEDYLHENGDDPRPRLVERLIEALGQEGAICTYSSYERQVIRALMAEVPERSEALASIEDRLFDLLPVVRNTYYHPNFRGSFSIKNVLPVLVPGPGYEDLSISDGLTAAIRYTKALKSKDVLERQRTFDDLRVYCAQDTLAMVGLCEALALLAC